VGTDSKRLMGGAMLALLLGVLAPTAALAGKIDTSSGSSSMASAAPKLYQGCGYATQQTFARFGDLAQYFLAPGGDAESSPWQTSGGATVTAGKGVLAVGGSVYSLPQGGGVTSGSFCLGFDSPTMRFSVKDPGVAGAVLKVEAIWKSRGGASLSLQLAKVRSGAAGVRLVDPVHMLANNTALVSLRGTTSVQLRFTAERGAWQVDDVYVDPYKRI
jgi:hypothetical protein